MPRPVLTLWLFNAVTLPIVGLAIALTPKAPTLLRNRSSQPVVAPSAKSIPEKPKPTQPRLQASTKESLTPLLIQPSAPDVKSLPKKLKPLLATPKQRVASPTLPSTTSRQVVADFRAVSVQKKYQPAFTPSLQPIVSILPPVKVPAQPFAAPEAELSPQQLEDVTPLPQAVTLPRSPEELLKPLATRESPSEEVQSLCQKFPRNSRCKDALPFAPLEALLAPEREPSPQEVQDLCQKFPLNSRCDKSTTVLEISPPTPSDTVLPDATSPTPSSTPSDLNLPSPESLDSTPSSL